MSSQRYTSDLSDEDWKVLQRYIPVSQSNKTHGGRPEKYEKREIVNALLYIKTTGCQWRNLPSDFPHWKSVYFYFHRWSNEGVLKNINQILVQRVRIHEGRKNHPSTGIIDSQSVKNTSITSVSGYDAAKKIKGIKRHIVTDILGMILDVIVTSADTTERSVAELLSMYISMSWSTVTTIFADGGYTGEIIGFIKTTFFITLQIVKRTDKHRFKILPKRWIVERTFSWLDKSRRLSKHYEVNHRHAESFVYLSMIHLMTKRLARGY
jgi:putative transposase